MSKRGNSHTEYISEVEITVETSGPGGDECSSLSFTAPLQDVQPGIIKLIKGESYPIDLDSNIPKVYNADYEICGTIISLMNAQLVKCLQRGRLFSAKILDLKGDVCTVAIKPK